MRKLHLGCGENYLEGFDNLDNNVNVKADILADMDYMLPFNPCTFDYIYSHHSLEHSKNFFFLMNELYRICKPDAIIEIYVPHFTSIYAFKYRYHYNYFGIGSFIMFTDNSASKQKEGNAKFKILDEKLSLLWKDKRLIFKIVNSFNFLFNFSKKWQQVCERFFIFGFDEVYYKLQVVK